MLRRMITTIWLLFIVTLTRFFFLLHNACTICILTPIEVIVACLRPLCPPSVFRDWEIAKDDDGIQLADRVENRSDMGATHDENSDEGCACSACLRARLYREHRSVSQEISEIAKCQISLPVKITTQKFDDISDANSPTGSLVSSASSGNMSRLRNYLKASGNLGIRNRSHEKLHETDLRRRLYRMQKSTTAEISDMTVVSRETPAHRALSLPLEPDSTIQSSFLGPDVGTGPHSREGSKNASYESISLEDNRAPARPSTPSVSSDLSSHSRLMRIFQFQRTKVRLTEHRLARYRSRIPDSSSRPAQSHGLSATVLNYRLNAMLRNGSNESLGLPRIDEQSPDGSSAESITPNRSPDSSGRRHIRDMFRRRMSRRRASLVSS
ncbi:hypothetical protein POJ06DRAFT_260205 [Lipomyces tetrasporus]|uniref:Uncharacterized protein n=1 Tax=Lipomyces tetrasporus TaxID=54092 RepID=A0AAD7QM80_9ASCO|nr:uncharacterized protein POJ06DRAFT_260205 [Lipomyces tetrasporus]KAJ8097819.1 hypothetical protein POJ06DRAFT_260205 [Lipomyces tetrasporus]